MFNIIYMKRTIFIILLSFLCIGTIDAQKRKTKSKTTKVTVVEKTVEEKLFDELLPSTAKVMFIDSIVVDKESFLKTLSLPASLGKMTKENGQVSYSNEFDNTKIFASGDTISGRHLYMSHKYGNKWEDARKVNEIENINPDYPFLMSDGVTLYFSAEGEGTVGGRDIFHTTYDADNACFYEATNMGLPYNSPANEYMLAISDIDDIGWLVSDRYQPEGKVCIYIFETTPQRNTFSEGTSNEELKKYASLASIKNTWSFGDRKAALARYSSMMKTVKRSESAGMEFIINDQTTYAQLSDFKNTQARKLYQEMESEKKRLTEMNTLLTGARTSYLETSKAKRHDIGRKIVTMETEIDALTKSIHEKEKEIRKLETK